MRFVRSALALVPRGSSGLAQVPLGMVVRVGVLFLSVGGVDPLVVGFGGRRTLPINVAASDAV